ncbi:MAG: F0F1 ATP synthase subunit alpha [Candidatus Margulisiibacteriota bacterium]|nr:MAG: F0F1 ATP synthase subunit alpha [Candidatus Margulisiibacteriota bacterium]HCY35963.1 F0F1 ATP synthase subunit alpha [Candidatus Margulisiibacteriota bacterium]
MQFDTEKIKTILKKKVDSYESSSKVEEIGMVLQCGDGIARIGGLPNAMYGEMVEFPDNKYGIVFNLERDEILTIILCRHTEVKEGAWVKSTGQIISVPVGEALLGRVVNAMGQPIDGQGPIDEKTYRFREIEKIAPGVVDRSPVCDPLQTGYKIVDALIPIGRGQRELIIGDRQTGKTALAVDTIINQKGKNVICIYVAIGQKSSAILDVVNVLKKHDAMDYTVVINASAHEPAASQFIAPFAGTAMAEEFMYNHKKDVLIIYDDLTKHAQAYRMISLLLERPPGREAYPGDIFYLHSRLLERASKLNSELGGGSITALPIIETQQGDISSYIPTNVISITDGQIFLQKNLFHGGFRPAVNVGTSVSRVGGKAQIPLMRKISGSLRIELAQYRERESFSAFSSELDKETQMQLQKGKILTELLKQDKQKPMPVAEQILSIYSSVNGFLNDIPLEKIQKFETYMLEKARNKYPELLNKLFTENSFTPELINALKVAIEDIKNLYNQEINLAGLAISSEAH